jgi:putative transcriptional regulator
VTFAEGLKAMRDSLGMTQEAFARELNVSFPTVNKWENNKTKPLRIIRDKIIELSISKGVSEDIIKALKNDN